VWPWNGHLKQIRQENERRKMRKDFAQERPRRTRRLEEANEGHVGELSGHIERGAPASEEERHPETVNVALAAEHLSDEYADDPAGNPKG
jgi:hypothetical protein